MRAHLAAAASLPSAPSPFAASSSASSPSARKRAVARQLRRTYVWQTVPTAYAHMACALLHTLPTPYSRILASTAFERLSVLCESRRETLLLCRLLVEDGILTGVSSRLLFDQSREIVRFQRTTPPAIALAAAAACRRRENTSPHFKNTRAASDAFRAAAVADYRYGGTSHSHSCSRLSFKRAAAPTAAATSMPHTAPTEQLARERRHTSANEDRRARLRGSRLNRRLWWRRLRVLAPVLGRRQRAR
ncbi:unnamed protein product [Agarophyton chilense]